MGCMKIVKFAPFKFISLIVLLLGLNACGKDDSVSQQESLRTAFNPYSTNQPLLNNASPEHVCSGGFRASSLEPQIQIAVFDTFNPTISLDLKTVVISEIEPASGSTPFSKTYTRIKLVHVGDQLTYTNAYPVSSQDEVLSLVIYPLSSSNSQDPQLRGNLNVFFGRYGAMNCR